MSKNVQFGFSASPRLPESAQSERPSDAIPVFTYIDLYRYIQKFASGRLELLLLLGPPGIGKTEITKAAVRVEGAIRSNTLYVEGHAKPFGLYQKLWEHRNQPVILDDLDRLYSNVDCVRILKALCSTGKQKRVSWVSNAVASIEGLPTEFSTSSNVILIANEWRSLNTNVRALEDRAITIWFAPSPQEIHSYVAEWFDDIEVYRFIGDHLEQIDRMSVRYYDKGRRLRQAGFVDWQRILLQMMMPRHEQVVVTNLLHDPELTTDQQRIEQFHAATGKSRRTYYRLKAKIKNQ